MPSVTKISPIETTGIKDEGMRALILLAHSLGWNTLLRQGQPCTLIAKDGTRLRLPTNTTVKESVFRGNLSSIITHSTEHTPTIELIDAVIRTVKKLSDSEKRHMRAALGVSAATHREMMAQLEPVKDDDLTETEKLVEQFVRNEGSKPVPTLSQEAIDKVFPPNPVATQPVGKPEPTVVSSKPFRARTATDNGYQYDSRSIIEQKMSDGTTRYKCSLCEYWSNNRNALNGHRRKHIGQPGVGTYRTGPQHVATPMDRPTIADAASQDVLDKIRELVIGDALDELVAENDDLKAENKRLQEALDDLAAKWDTLQSLFNPKGDKT